MARRYPFSSILSLLLLLLSLAAVQSQAGKLHQEHGEAPVRRSTDGVVSLSGSLFETDNVVPGEQAHAAARPRLVPRQLRNSTTNANATISEAEQIVLAAQAEARGAQRPGSCPMCGRNRYEFHSPTPSKGLLSSSGDDNATGVNETVAEAAAVLTEVMIQNGTLSVDDESAASDGPLQARQSGTWWLEGMTQNGLSPFAPSGYKVWRNVKDYGAKGDGVTDDTAAINKAVSDQNRCGLDCGSTTTLQAVVYFPPGTYIISGSIIQYYHTQFIGHPTNRPVLKASPAFVGLGMISSDVYVEGGEGAQWYINQSNFLRQVRNFVLDMTSAPLQAYVAAIHWQVAQATSLQNIKFVMSTVAGNNQQGMFMENGSGGFMSDLEFVGGALGMYVGNQQFSVRNLKFSNHLSKAIEIHWDWGWTWKGVEISNCPVGIVMVSPDATTKVGSAIFIDSKITNCPVGLQLQKPAAKAAISLSLFSVTTSNVPAIVKYVDGATLLAGSTGTSTVAAWGVGKRYDTQNGEASGVQQSGAYPRAPVISGGLLKNPSSQTSGFFDRSKPQSIFFVARGVLIREHQTPSGCTGTAERALRPSTQYQTIDASNIFHGHDPDGSRPTFKDTPRAPAPFGTAPAIYKASDPTFDFCKPGERKCAVSWGVRIVNSEKIYIYGAGLYSWFDNYDQACVGTEDCQRRMVSIETSSDIWIYSLITKATIEMISPVGGVAVLGKDNKINYCDVVMAWLGSATGGSASKGVIYRSPISATVIPLSATTVPKGATLTIDRPVASNVVSLPKDGNQNQPKGPGASKCNTCDLARAISSTCCGTGGSLGNPINVPAGVPIPRPFLLPPGFVPNQPIVDTAGKEWQAGVPLTQEVEVPAGTVFTFPLIVPAGLPFSDKYTPEENQDDDDSGALYLPADFWEGEHTVSCRYPCTIVYPPSATTTTWIPPPLTTVVSSQTITFTVEKQTTEKVHISKTTVKTESGSQPTVIVAPVPAPKPLCISYTIPVVNIKVKFGLCPPDLKPFPPPIPKVTIIPVPPGGKPGPTTPGNKPSEEQEQQEDDETRDNPVCPFIPYISDDYDSGLPGYNPFDPENYDPDTDSYPWKNGGSGNNGGGGSSSGPGAGTGTPKTTTIPVPPKTTRTTTATTPVSTSNPVPKPTDPPKPKPPQPGTNKATCWGSGRQVYGHELQDALNKFCDYADGTRIHSNQEFAIAKSGSWWSMLHVGVTGKNNCEFTIRAQECKDILNEVVGCKPYSASLLRIGGYVENNCAVWNLDPDASLDGECPPIPIPLLRLFCAAKRVFD
ncbi:glucan 1,3-beta-glucosidase [Verticillium alfalfae VaMs.102]|uniref:Glucan 1,3-beta-glucosidase n=1 Tax=Verticillium alfalfae (strain VaMs.102 / ATCC MYA-4576 / FGSC 10136) TaxID=526221 RepID=C9SM16_VERA1|nr:glucan 1,3-beta-glucosidase [Verticillium alfalfae VaMs.102]EEY19831.1 glucan 1,3-beta-glucosidase [Verticillium alfalfae VaMs.102]